MLDFTGDMLAAELGPGLLGRVYDGLLNPLPELAEQCGFFLQRGTYLPSLDRVAKWEFTPKAAVGDRLTAGETVGTVPEGVYTHRIMIPFAWRGVYTVQEVKLVFS